MEIQNELMNWLSPIIKSPMGALTVGVTVVFIYLMKAWPKFNNDIVPHFSIPFAGFLFAVIGDRALVPDSVPLGAPRTVALVAYGLMLGFGAVLLYSLIIKRITDKLGGADSQKTR